MVAPSLRSTTTPERRAPLPAWLLLGAVCLPPAIVAVVVLALFGVPLVVAVILPLVVAAAVAAWLVRSADAVATAGLHLQPALEEDQPRLFNMVEGLCDSHGFRRPAIYVIDTEARNALVWGRRPGSPSLAISRGWLDATSLLGLEGLLARELARANDPSLPSTTLAVSVARVLPGGLRRRLFDRVCGEHRMVLDDFDAVRFTRYPPGLADALATQRDGTATITGTSSVSAPLWVAPSTTDHLLGDAVAPIDIRVDALREL